MHNLLFLVESERDAQQSDASGLRPAGGDDSGEQMKVKHAPAGEDDSSDQL